MFLFTRLRRNRLKSLPFPPGWEKVLEVVPLYRRLPVADRGELKGLIRVFLHEKAFEGCGGFAMTDEARVIVAAQACILLLHRDSGFFPGLSSIIIYPDEYFAPFKEMDESGVVTEWTDRRSGESCQEGAIVLSWKDVTMEEMPLHDAYNVVLHEFAHQLDAEEGITAEAAPLADGTRCSALNERLRRGHLRLKHDLAHGRVAALDPYGEENVEEFFAVATESFFERPLALRNWDRELYTELADYFRQDPAEWTHGRISR
ncbi:MAG TPA: M90 family metallopeptidase [Geobacteraceae bacterium]